MDQHVVGPFLEVRPGQNALDVPHGRLIVGQLAAAEYQRIEAVELGGHHVGGEKRDVELVDVLGKRQPHTAGEHTDEGRTAVLEHELFGLGHGNRRFDLGVLHEQFDGPPQHRALFFGGHFNPVLHLETALGHDAGQRHQHADLDRIFRQGRLRNEHRCKKQHDQ